MEPTMIDLAERQDNGIIVKLWWFNAAETPDCSITVTVRDLHNGECFSVNPPQDKALDAFYHPNAYRKD